MVKKAKKKDKGAEEKILSAARKVFITRGMAGARMQDIADEAGINKALLHYYFRDKDKLFELVFLEEAQKFFPKINAIFNSDATLFDKIENFVNEYIDEMQQNPYLPWFVLNEVNRDPDQFMYKIWGKENLPKPGKFLEQMEKGNKKRNHQEGSSDAPVHEPAQHDDLSFCGKPMMMRNMQMNEAQFRDLMEQRRKEVPKFIMDAIKK